MMLPRTIDKARALLPGGDPGDYSITPGLSAWLLGEAGLTEAEFLVLVHRAADEQEVARIIEERIEPQRRDPLNAHMKALRVRDLPADARERFVRLHAAQDDELVIDVLVTDDRGMLQPAK
jgi:hypothetical protein